MQKENLIKFCKNILIKLNMDSDKAHATSEILVEADMMGHSTHGVRLLPNYVSDIEKGIMNVSGNYKIISEKKSLIRKKPNGEFFGMLFVSFKSLKAFSAKNG